MFWHQDESFDSRRPAGHEPSEIAPAAQQIGEMIGERVSRLAGRYHHFRFVRRREVCDDPQSGAKALRERLSIVTDRARPAIERVIPARCRDRDAEPITQHRDPAEDWIRKL